MLSEVTALEAIKAALDLAVVDKSGTTWEALTDEQRQYQLVECSYWKPMKSINDIGARNNISESVHAFILWGDSTGSETNGMIKNQPILFENDVEISLLTSNIESPQINLMKCEQTVFNSLKNVEFLTFVTNTQKWSIIEDSSLVMLTMTYKRTNIQI
jgi:hypothetical protein